MKKRSRLMVCLVAGVLILAVSATAAFGSANGYSSYKNAVMDLALKEENFTAKGTVEVKLDGKAFTTMDVNYAQDGVNRSTCTSTTEDGETYIHWDTTLNGVDTWFSSESDVYWQAQVDRDNTSLLGYGKNDEMQSRLINFLSIAADTVAGDLKNNFVQAGSQDGKDLYQVSISGSQVPSLVNAGLSLFAYEAAGGDNYDCGQITWDNYWAAEIAYYEKTTGETLSQELKTGLMEGYDEAFYEAHKAEINKLDEASDKMYDHYNEILEQKGNVGVVYVKDDGSYDYYPTWMDYLAAQKGQGVDNMEYYIAKELTLEKVDCTVSLDKDGRLTDNQITATFQATDAKGGRHTLEVTGNVTVSGYGTTQIQPLDVGDRTKSV